MLMKKLTFVAGETKKIKVYYYANIEICDSEFHFSHCCASPSSLSTHASLHGNSFIDIVGMVTCIPPA